MATLKIPYKGVNYPLYLTPTKETTPALKVGNLGYVFLAQGKALGESMLYGSSILKGAPLKITKDGISYRAMYESELGDLGDITGDITCDVYYNASYTLHEASQVISRTHYKYYWDTYSNIKITNFAITNGDMRIVMDNFTCNGYNVLDTQSSWYSTKSGWGGWDFRRYTTYPAKASYTLTATASGTYSLQSNVNNTWITCKTGTASCNFSVPINSETQQKVTVPLKLE